MNSQKLSAAIRDFTLKARELLLREINEQLEGIYGFLPSGKFEPADKYPAIKLLTEAAENRKRLEQFIADEKATGMTAKEARNKLVLEIAFTRLNRTVALKMMETRSIIRPSVARGVQSNGYLRWLTRPENENYYNKHEAGDLPRNPLGEGPRQEAYRHYLLWVCTELSKEIKVLFDPDNLASRIFPRPAALNELIAMMNADILEEAWQPGNEETIGWVYQSFNAEELENAFREVRISKTKFEAKDIPNVTQLFTRCWVVRYLVENTLGRIWLDMHPDSLLGEHMDYLVPVQGIRKTSLKSVKNIRFLDPACGTMHFGLVAFDLFVQMYQEEIKNAGKPGWPQMPPLENEDQISEAIIANNIHGIDIDHRAVQLSAMTLYLKAKTLNKKAILRESRLACGNVRMLNGDRLKVFLNLSGLDQRPIYGRILSALQIRLKDSEQIGSLLRLEEEVRELVEGERKFYERNGKQLNFPGFTEVQFESHEGKNEFWEVLEIQIRQALDLFAKESANQGNNQTFFAGETTKGLQFLDIISGRYDVVVTNPPYISNRKMNLRLKKLIGDGYPEGKGDAYAAFIQRCIEFAVENGHIGMLTMHSFMFISSYGKLRDYIRERAAIENMVHAGPGLFDVGNPGTLQTSAYVLIREPDKQIRDASVGIYFRLVKESDSEAKRQRFEEALSNIKNGQPDPVVFKYRQGDFDAIPGSPWVYWITTKLRNIFSKSKNLAEIAPPRQGLATADNFRFLKYWWEVGTDRIAFNCGSREKSEELLIKWYPYMKGGSFKRWYGNQAYTINYGQNGFELKAWADPLYGNSGWSRIIKSTDFYFRRCVSWSDLTSGRFSARLSPGGFIFDVKGSSAFPENIPLTLALLNSSFAYYILNLLNPTVSFQVGDLSRLPVPNTSSLKIENLVKEAIELSKTDSKEDETTYDFIMPAAWKTGIEDVTARHQELAEIEHQIDDEVYQLYGISNEDRAAIEVELGDTSIFNPGDDDEDKTSTADEETESSQIPSLTHEDLARQWISYAVGMVMGRFQPGIENGLGRGHFSDDINEKLQKLTDPDAILVLDEGHSDDLPQKVLSALAIMLNEKQVGEVVKAATGKDGPTDELLRNYLERTFFKEHIRQYRKRPVYWLLQSPKKNYGVWLFHEKMNADTLYRIRTEYVVPKINLLEKQINDIRHEYDRAEGKKQREFEKQMAGLNDVLDDIREFQKLLTFISEERGYKPRIDDGVLLNMAPLWELIPSWQAEPKKAWKALEWGDYDWAHQAMDHWPDRVRKKCLTNKSFAIAHGLE